MHDFRTVSSRTYRPVSLKDSLAKALILLKSPGLTVEPDIAKLLISFWLSTFINNGVFSLVKVWFGDAKNGTDRLVGKGGVSWHICGHIPNPDTSQPWPHFSCPPLRTPFFPCLAGNFWVYYTLERER